MEPFDYVKQQARRQMAEQQGKSTHSGQYAMSDVPTQLELTTLDLPVDVTFQSPLRDPATGRRIILAGYGGAGEGGAGG